MTERATIFQGVQVGVESTPGTAVAANRKLAATSIEPSIKVTTNKFKPMGTKFTTIAPLGKEWSEAKISGPLTYTDFVYLMASGVAYAAPAQQGATTAYKWTSTPNHSSEDTTKTFTVEVGSGVRAHKIAYGQVNGLGYTIDREKAEVKGNMIAQQLTDAITMTASPTTVALQPVLPTEVCYFADDTAAGLGTTKLLRVLSCEFEFNDRYGPVWPIDCAVTSFAATVETEPKTTFKIKMAADAVGMGLLTTLRTGAKKFFRVQATGPLIDTPYTYLWQHDLCGVVTDVDEFSDEDGVYMIGWTFDVAYDGTWGKAFEYQVTNAISAL